MSESKVLVTRYFEEIFNQRNYDVCDEILAEEYLEWAVAPFGRTAPGQVNGPSHTKESARWLIEQFPDLHMTVEAIVAECDLVACRTCSEGTNLGRLNGVFPPTAKHFSARQSHWFRVRENKLAEHWATREDLSMLLQIGIITPPQD